MTVTPTPEDRRYTVPQASAVANVSPSWIYGRVASGDLERDAPAYKGERMRIRRSALEKMGKVVDESLLKAPTAAEMKDLEDELTSVRDMLREQLRRNEDLHGRLTRVENESQRLLEEVAELRGEPVLPRSNEDGRLRRQYRELVGGERAEPRRSHDDQ